MQNDLGVASIIDDVGVTGATGVLDFAGLGPYTIDFSGLNDYGDEITPNSSGSVAFVDDDGHTVGVNTDTTVFFAFLWEAIANENETNGQGVMQAIIDHLTADLPLDFAPDQQATITVTAPVDAATSGTIINTAGVTSPELAPSDAREPTTVQAAEPSPPTSGAWPAPRTARATSAPTKPGLPWP